MAFFTVNILLLPLPASLLQLGWARGRHPLAYMQHVLFRFKTGSTRFQFTSQGPARPQFSGYVVYSYDSYASLSA
jgi:hypothetical protein